MSFDNEPGGRSVDSFVSKCPKPSSLMAAGALSSIYLARRGFKVDVVEKTGPEALDGAAHCLAVGRRSFMIVLHRR